MTELKLRNCPFCGGEARTSFRQYRFKGQNYYGEKHDLRYVGNRGETG